MGEHGEQLNSCKESSATLQREVEANEERGGGLDECKIAARATSPETLSLMCDEPGTLAAPSYDHSAPDSGE